MMISGYENNVRVFFLVLDVSMTLSLCLKPALGLRSQRPALTNTKHLATHTHHM